jgi:8-hydroxy-5-deazaflavin:NADPH oxidoreductase
MKTIAVIGSGAVGEALSAGLLEHGYAVVRGSRQPSKLEDWKKGAGANASAGTFAEAARQGELVVLAVKGTGAEEAVSLCGEGLSGKTVLDTTNPISEEPPVNGVLKFFTGPNESLMERLQKRAPSGRFVECFSSVGSVSMVNPSFGGTKPSMFICGNDTDAKGDARKILDQFGWETEDMGGVEAARAIEPLCILWCIPGFARNQWTHAFKLLKK